MKAKIEFTIVWFDDQKAVHESSIPHIKQRFKHRYNCNLQFVPFTNPDLFLNYVFSKTEIDFIFLDIDLGSQISGFDIYADIRRKLKKIKIVFVSAHLIDSDWEDKVMVMQEKDDNLFSIKNSFPNTLTPEYHKEIVLPIINLINKQTGYFDYSFEKFLELNKQKRRKIVEFSTLFNEPYAKEYLGNNSNVQWVVMGHEPNKILKSGKTVVSVRDLIDMSENLGAVLSFYGPNDRTLMDNYIEQKPPLSIETINGQVLYLAEDYVILKCRLNSSIKAFQVRKFDIEPFKDVVNLDEGNIVEIKIITYPGERKYKFTNGNPSISNEFVVSGKLNIDSSHIKPLS